MAKYIKLFLYMILFTLVVNGYSGTSNAQDHRCANFILSIFPDWSQELQGITFGSGVRLGGSTVELQVQFHVRKAYYSGRSFTTIGEGKI